MKKFLLNNLFIIIDFIILVALFCLYISFNFNRIIILFNVIKYLFFAVGNYFIYVFTHNNEEYYGLYDALINKELSFNNGINVPGTSDSFIEYIKQSFFISFNYDNFLYSNFYVLNIFSNITLIVFIIIVLFILILLLKSIYETPKDPYLIGEKDSIKSFRKFSYKFNIYFYQYFKKFICSFFVGVNKYFLIVLILLVTNGLMLLINAISYLFIFLKLNNLSSIFEFVYTSLIIFNDVFNGFYLFLLIIVIFIFYIVKRFKKADSFLYFYEMKDEEFIKKNTSVINYIMGPPGAGKTTLCTDFVITNDKVNKDILKEILIKYSNFFPQFDCKQFELFIDRYFNKWNLFNHILISDFINRYIEHNNMLFRNGYINQKSYIKRYFGYNLLEYKFKYFDGIKYITFYDFLKIYAVTFYYYNLDENCIASNYPIQTYQFSYNSQYFKNFHYNFCESQKKYGVFAGNFSVILDFNMNRLFKKTVSFDYGLYGFGTYAETEKDKEHGNQITNRYYKVDSDEANPLNDGYNDYKKFARQMCILDNIPFYKEFSEMQRKNSLNADNFEIAESTFYIREKKQSNCLPLFFIDKIICNFIIEIGNKYESVYRNTRNYISLTNLLLRSFFNIFRNYFLRISNRYGFVIVTLDLKDGSDEKSKGKKCNYFLLNTKIYNKRFNTATFSGIFAESMRKDRKGFKNYKRYQSLDISMGELESQNSYLAKKLKTRFDDTPEKDKFSDF